MNTPVTTSEETSHVRTSHHRRVRVLYSQSGLLLVQMVCLLGIIPGACKMLVKLALSAFVQLSPRQEEVSA